MPDFAALGLAANLGIFAAAAAAVWLAGTRISRYANAISERTGLGHALLGLLLLGGVTSLPELAVSATAARSGDAALAVNNILGGVAMQVAILVIGDVAIGRRALTSVVPDPIVMLQGTFCILLLATVAAGVVVGDVPLLGIGLWSWAVLGLALYALHKLAAVGGRQPWIANRDLVELPEHDAGTEADPRQSWRRLIAKTVAAGAVILVAGFLLSKTGETIAAQTGLGSSFVGAVLVALSTSLPEISTVLAAARLGLYTMAISDIFGTNVFDLALLFVVDGVAAGEPVLDRVGTFSAVGALLGLFVTALYLVGLAERRDRTLLRMGVDSAAVLLVYLGGLVLLYTLR